MSVFNGPVPFISRHSTAEAEIAAVAKFIGEAIADGIAPSEVGVFVRSRDQLDRARGAVKKAGFVIFELSGESEDQADRIAVGIMHLAKGLEFIAADQPARNKGTCDNLLTVRRDELEAKVLDGLKEQLMQPELVTAFIDEFHKEVNRQRAEQDGRRDRTARDLEKTEREIRRLIEAIKAGVLGAAVKDEMTILEAKRVELFARFEAAPPPMPRLHPNLADLYRQKVMNLAQALNDEHMRLEAAECIRELIEEIRLVPDNAKLRVKLFGELAALINLANEHPRSKGTGVQITLVAGCLGVLVYESR